MKKEIVLFFRQKYYIIILAIMAVIIFSFTMQVTEGGAKSYKDEAYNSDFGGEIYEYHSFSELSSMIKRLENTLAEEQAKPNTSQENIESIKYSIELYKMLLSNSIAYDQTSNMDSTMGNLKHTQFHFFGLFEENLGIFVIIISCILGSIIPTICFTNKTAKLLFINGESRSKILLNKYLSSLLIIICFDLFVSVFMAIISLGLSSTGMQSVYLAIDGQFVILNYFEYVLLHLGNQIVFIVTIYTLVFYFSLALKNTIIALSINMIILVLSIVVIYDTKNSGLILLAEMGKHGIIAFCRIKEAGYMLSANMVYYLVYVAAAFCAVVLGNLLLNHFDCSK